MQRTIAPVIRENDFSTFLLPEVNDSELIYVETLAD